MSRYEKMNPDDFKHMTWGPGIILDEFDPETGTVEATGIRWATTGTNSFSATRELVDMGADINNCPEGTKQLQRAKPWQAQLTGTAITVTPTELVTFFGNADIATGDDTKVVPRNLIDDKDFTGKWLIVNYSEYNGETKGGYMAIHLKNTLSTNGFTANFEKEKNGQFPYTLKAYYDMADIDTVPFEIYVKAGEAEGAA